MTLPQITQLKLARDKYNKLFKHKLSHYDLRKYDMQSAIACVECEIAEETRTVSYSKWGINGFNTVQGRMENIIYEIYKPDKVDKINEVKKLRSQGLPYLKIACRLHISDSTARLYANV